MTATILTTMTLDEAARDYALRVADTMTPTDAPDEDEVLDALHRSVASDLRRYARGTSSDRVIFARDYLAGDTAQAGRYHRRVRRYIRGALALRAANL